MKLWLSGSLVEEEDARVSPLDRGFTLGDGLFETLRVARGRVLRQDAHLARLASGGGVLGLPLAGIDIPDALARTIAANGLAEGVLRLTVTRGRGPRGVLPPTTPVPTVVVTAAPLPAPASPARLIFARGTRRNERSPLSRIKSLNYLDNILARQEAAAGGADDAILLNTQERVAETSIANVFAVIGAEMLTPPLAEGVLPGVMRAAVLAAGAAERPLTPQDLADADAIVLTSALGIRAVAALESRPLASEAVVARLRGLVEGG